MLTRLGQASLLLAGGAFGSFGCGSRTGGANAPVTVRFWNGWTGPDGAKALAIVRAFNAANPDVKVQM